MTQTDFYTMADQLHRELDALFTRYPSLHPRNRGMFLLGRALENEEIQRIFQQFANMMEEVGRTFAEVLVEVLEPVVDVLGPAFYVDMLHRDTFYWWLKERRVPCAWFLSRHWPRRWIPEMDYMLGREDDD